MAIYSYYFLIIGRLRLVEYVKEKQAYYNSADKAYKIA